MAVTHVVLSRIDDGVGVPSARGVRQDAPRMIVTRLLPARIPPVASTLLA